MYRYLTLLLLLLSPLCASARQITSSEAVSIANDFLKGKNFSRHVPASENVTALTATDANHLPFYIVTTPENAGFILVSGDSETGGILGYSLTGSFDPANIPPQLSEILERLGNRPSSIHPSNHRTNICKENSTESGEVLLTTPEWGQGAPYNSMTPIVDGEHTPTGCVATAMSIIMKYHNWPESGRGAKSDYFHKDFSFDYDNTIFNYQDMESQNIDDREKSISTLMKGAGISVDTRYDPEESSATGYLVANALTYRFKFSGDCQFIYKDKFTDSRWHEIIKFQIDSNIPILYSGVSSSAGHMFVIDGYSEDGMYHVNWGWDGNYNGYFSLDELLAYNDQQAMVINAIPDKEARQTSAFLINDHYIESISNYGMNFSSSNPAKEEAFFGVGPYLIDECYEENVVTKEVGIALTDGAGNIVELLGKGNVHSAWRVECGDYKLPRMMYAFQFPELRITKEIESPDWSLQLVSRDSEQHPWVFINGTMTMPTSIRISELPSHWSTFTFDCPTPEEFEITPVSFAEEGRALKGAFIQYDIFYGAGKLSFHDESAFIPTDLKYHTQINTLTKEDDYYFKFEYIAKKPYEDSQINTGTMAILDGIVYELQDSGKADVIGYTQNTTEYTIIPETININGIDRGVVRVQEGAFANAPNIKHLEFQGEVTFNPCAFSRIPSLESIMIRKPVGLHNYVPERQFFKTGNVRAIYTYPELCHEFVDRTASSIFNLHGHTPAVFSANPDYWVHTAEWPHEDMDLFVPGGYGIYAFRKDPQNYKENFKEMWEYKVYNDHFILKSNFDNITIDSVLVNGVQAMGEDGGYYAFDMLTAPQITVNYTVDNIHPMTSDLSWSYYSSWLRNFAMVEEIVLSEENLTIAPDDTFTLSTTIVPQNANNKSIRWSSSDENIATVDVGGTVRGINEGTAVITAKANGGYNKTAMCLVTVDKNTGMDISISDRDEYVKIYNLSGSLVYDGLYSNINLMEGIYIIVSPNYRKKIQVK